MYTNGIVSSQAMLRCIKPIPHLFIANNRHSMLIFALCRRQKLNEFADTFAMQHALKCLLLRKQSNNKYMRGRIFFARVFSNFLQSQDNNRHNKNTRHASTMQQSIYWQSIVLVKSFLNDRNGMLRRCCCSWMNRVNESALPFRCLSTMKTASCRFGCTTPLAYFLYAPMAHTKPQHRL